MNGKTPLPCGVPGVPSQGRKVKDMCKTLAGQGTYFWTLSMLGISTHPLNAVPEHTGIIHAFTNHEPKKEHCPHSFPWRRNRSKGGCLRLGAAPADGVRGDTGTPGSLQRQGTGMQTPWGSSRTRDTSPASTSLGAAT